MEKARPVDRIMEIGTGLWLSRALWCACRLKIADAIDGEPVAVEALAAATGGHPAMLGRLMRSLSAFGIFERHAGDRFSHSPLSEVLRSDHPASQRAFVESVFGCEHYEAWGAIEATLRTGATAFDVRYGMPIFDYYSKHPETAALFSQAMTGTTRVVDEAVLSTHRFLPFTLAVDIGGSQGSLLRGVLGQHPDARGILFDLPDVTELARAAWEHSAEGPRIEAQSGNFFRAVPEGGDLYLLKFILHDWTDEEGVTILSNIRAAIRSGGRVAIVEMVLPDGNGPHLGWLMDLNMMTQTGGRERTVGEYEAMLSKAGFRLDRVTPTPSPVSVVEAVPVG